MIFFHECKSYLDNLSLEDGGVLETVERKINDLRHRKELTPSRMLKVYDRAGGILILKLQGQGRNSRVIIQEYVEEAPEGEYRIYFLRDYISQSEYEPRWRMRIEPEVEKGNYLTLYPLPEEDRMAGRQAYRQWAETPERILQPLPDNMMEWLLDFSVEQDFSLYESREWVRFAEREMSGYEGDFYRLLRALYYEERATKYQNVEILHEHRHIWHAHDDQVYIIYEKTGPFSGKGSYPVILLHTGGLMLQADRCLQDLERVKNYKLLAEVIEGAYTPELVSRAAYRAYPESALRERQRWQDVQKRSARSNLALSPEQVDLLRNYHFPKFINGQAGSGKSEMLYYLFAEICFRKEANEFPGAPVFLTENEELLERALYDTIDKLKNNSVYREYGLDDDQLHGYFSPFQQFIVEQLIDDPDKYPAEKGVNFSRFKQLYENSNLPQHIKRRFPAEIAWFVIYTFIKGYDAVKEELIPEEFDELPRRDKSIIDRDTYTGVYNEVWRPFYRNLQKQQGYWDRLDLVKEVLNQYEHIPEEKKFTVILCDEAQDFTRVELQLLIKLSKYLDYDLSDIKQFPVTFAGDPFQTVNPTGFSLEKLKRLFTTELERYSNLRLDHDFTEELRYNYRSGAPIVNLANVVQYIRFRFLDTTDLRYPQEAKQMDDFNIPEFFSFRQWGTDLLEKLKYGVFLLPCNDGEVDVFLSEDPQLGRIDLNAKSAARAKGTEYPMVILYGFGTELIKEMGMDFFRRLLDQEIDFGQLSPGEQFKLSFFFNKLYVAITRAQERLIIIDSDEALACFWKLVRDHEALCRMEGGQWEKVDSTKSFSEGNVESLGAPDFATAKRTADADREAGILYSDPKKMADAARAYRNLGPEYESKAVFCEAKGLEFEGKFVEAGEKFESIRKSMEASRCYWIEGKWEALLNVNRGHLDDPKFQIRSFVAEVMLDQATDISSLVRHRANIANAFRDRELRVRLNWIETFFTKLCSGLLKQLDALPTGKKEELADILVSFRLDNPVLYETAGRLYFHGGAYQQAVDLWDRIEKFDSKEYAQARYSISQDISQKIYYLSKYDTHSKVIDLAREYSNTQLNELAAEIVQKAYLAENDFLDALKINETYQIPWVALFSEIRKNNRPVLRNFLSFLEDHIETLTPKQRVRYLTPETFNILLGVINEEQIIRQFLTGRRAIKMRDIYESLRTERNILEIIGSIIRLIGFSSLTADHFGGQFFRLARFHGFCMRRKTSITDKEYLLFVCALERTRAVLKDLPIEFTRFDRFMLRDQDLDSGLRRQLEKRWLKIRFKLDRRELKDPNDSALTDTDKELIMEAFRGSIRDSVGRDIQIYTEPLDFRQLSDWPDLPDFDSMFGAIDEQENGDQDTIKPIEEEESSGHAPKSEDDTIEVEPSVLRQDEEPTLNTDGNGRMSVEVEISSGEISQKKSVFPSCETEDEEVHSSEISVLRERIRGLEKQLHLKDQLLAEKERSIENLRLAISVMKKD